MEALKTQIERIFALCSNIHQDVEFLNVLISSMERSASRGADIAAGTIAVRAQVTDLLSSVAEAESAINTQSRELSALLSVTAYSDLRELIDLAEARVQGLDNIEEQIATWNSDFALDLSSSPAIAQRDSLHQTVAHISGVVDGLVVKLNEDAQSVRNPNEDAQSVGNPNEDAQSVGNPNENATGYWARMNIVEPMSMLYFNDANNVHLQWDPVTDPPVITKHLVSVMYDDNTVSGSELKGLGQQLTNANEDDLWKHMYCGFDLDKMVHVELKTTGSPHEYTDQHGYQYALTFYHKAQENGTKLVDHLKSAFQDAGHEYVNWAQPAVKMFVVYSSVVMTDFSRVTFKGRPSEEL